MLGCYCAMLGYHNLKGSSTTTYAYFLYRVSSLQTDIQSSLTAVGFSGTVSVATPAKAAQVCAKQILSLALHRSNYSKHCYTFVQSFCNSHVYCDMKAYRIDPHKYL